MFSQFDSEESVFEIGDMVVGWNIQVNEDLLTRSLEFDSHSRTRHVVELGRHGQIEQRQKKPGK
jgi:hypothetical protein